MKKRGFTLVELLAVIAVLGILVVLALPNVIKNYKKAQKQVFVTELQSISNASLQKWANEDMLEYKDTYVYCKSGKNSRNPLNLNGQEKYYYVELNKDGETKKVIVWDNKQYIKYTHDDQKNISELTIDDIVTQNMDDIDCDAVTTELPVIAKPEKTYVVNASTDAEGWGSPIVLTAAISEGSKATGFNKVKYLIYRKVTSKGETEYTQVDEIIVSNKSENFKYIYTDPDLIKWTDSPLVSYSVQAFTVDDNLIAETTSDYIYCFVAGTKVLTEGGYKNIEDVKVGEKVYSYNLDNNELELKEVTKTIESSTIDTYTLTIGGEKVEMTPKHQLYIVDKGWVRAYDVKVGDKMLTSDNKIVEIENIEYKIYDKEIKTYNLTVDGNNNYFVTDIQILVHIFASVS